MNWGEANRILDDAIIGLGIVIMILRQFFWRSAETNQMLRMPIILILAALGYLIIEIWSGFGWVSADWIILGELALVACTGTAMGYVTRFRTEHGRVQYKLTASGIWLWGLFVCIRVGWFYLALHLGANIADATGIILLSFGVNRFAAILVVRRRAREHLMGKPLPATQGAH